MSENGFFFGKKQLASGEEISGILNLDTGTFASTPNLNYLSHQMFKYVTQGDSVLLYLAPSHLGPIPKMSHFLPVDAEYTPSFFVHTTVVVSLPDSYVPFSPQEFHQLQEAYVLLSGANHYPSPFLRKNKFYDSLFVEEFLAADFQKNSLKDLEKIIK